MTLRLAAAVLASLLFAPAALAGTVDVAMEAGTVTVTGSQTADVVTLAQTAEGITVTPGAGTGTDAPPASGCVRDPMSQVVTCSGAEDAVLRGEGGNDTLTGGAEDDDLTGGPGADDLRGGDGTDRARFPGSLAQRVTLDDIADDGGAGEGDNARSDIEDLVTGSGDDAVGGSAAANDIATRGGADTIDPGAGADRVRAGAGDDHVRSRDDRTDAVACGDGTDRLVSDPGDDPAACESVDASIPPTGPDSVRPQIALTLATAIRPRDMGKGVPLTVTADEPVTAVIEILGYSTRARVARAGDFVLASRTVRGLTGARAVVVKIARRRLRMIRRRAMLTVRVTANDGAGTVTVASKAFRVR